MKENVSSYTLYLGLTNDLKNANTYCELFW